MVSIAEIILFLQNLIRNDKVHIEISDAGLGILVNQNSIWDVTEISETREIAGVFFTVKSQCLHLISI